MLPERRPESVAAAPLLARRDLRIVLTGARSSAVVVTALLPSLPASPASGITPDRPGAGIHAAGA